MASHLCLRLPVWARASRTRPERCPVTQLDSDCHPVVHILMGGNPALRPETSRDMTLGQAALTLLPQTHQGLEADGLRAHSAPGGRGVSARRARR